MVGVPEGVPVAVPDDVPDAEGAADVASGLAELVPGAVVACVCGPLGPHPLSISAAAAAAVVIANPCEIR
ncbi:hypothetical protein AAIH32_17960 [Pseudarthrobacter oxydans]|uniref:hypothetical protein n=1 Tax=Pseudarthrobacter oxydans TaxID=1671 RepID=UPI003D2BA302